MKRLLCLLPLALVFMAGSPVAHGATVKCNDDLPLHTKLAGKPASCGQRVKDLQWLLGGHKPNVFKEVKPTFTKKPNGLFGAYTVSAVNKYRFRIGYPATGQCGAKVATWKSDYVTGFFFNVLEGRAKRPACWVALAASRVRSVVPTPEPTSLGAQWAALLGDWLGIHETGVNVGPCISTPCVWHGKSYPAIQASTGAYGAAWCVSTQQAVAKLLGLPLFANGTAGVYYAVDYYAARNETYAKPKLYSLVAFLDYDSAGHRIPGTGHMGFVTAVYANSFTYRAGNDNNAVSEHTIPDGSRPYVFLRLDKVTVP